MNGIIPLYKPCGMTSADCVYQLRKILQERKIGHTGTLDPQVDGVLVICVGQATKLVNYLMRQTKTYNGQITLGKATTTEDATGKTVAQKHLSQPFTTQQIEQAMQALTGSLQQTPPLYSAVKVNGKRLYEYARSHQEVQRPTRTVHIYKFELTQAPIFHIIEGEQVLQFTVQCSKGTYIRTLAVQLGELLQVPAHMNQLTRVSGGGFNLEETFTLQQIQAKIVEQQQDFLIPLSQVFTNLPTYDLNIQQWQYVQNGRFLELKETAPQVALYYQKVLKAIYQRQQNLYVPQLMLLKNDR
ncbi:tRNA pseudouridine(55) synthase TruB [Lactobacillus sp. W8089]|nr:tRNA pseudouridine(55) synthase TruB [Lactobacillus sp. W8086]MBI0109219.1 tRNA pseudouridine(55) synthase TruB [Lactobacillus sp. W8085]MBI0112396.1 tRNA pseudouridine(55) synthase TruB [Lactobacillus sp. W8088]MBI0116151.1 tRNA pseudouridine(55) synthase TruB [Lactobacillus sp. W8087]MBI0119837.1 tRNA pseudouridine(55) synthase TruB [Lactobacillus sp. W8089]MBI0131802.1 tRNA pseudouridine(55) synthase TruB [Lactobacillus sp. W8090]